MIYNEILVRFGDLTLKGKNQNTFLRSLYKLVGKKMEGLDGIEIEYTHDRIFIHLNGVDHNLVIERLNRVSGLSSYSLVVECSDDINTIKETALALMQEVVVDKPVTFKVDTKRANKSYPLNSMEITKVVSGYVLSHHNLLRVDVHNPMISLLLEVRGGKCYLYNTSIKAMGGYPVGIAGK
jgi:thiamine biosynthesis protein ThiI